MLTLRIHQRPNVLGISKHGRVLSITRGLFLTENEESGANNSNPIIELKEDLDLQVDLPVSNEISQKQDSNTIPDIKTQDDVIADDEVDSDDDDDDDKEDIAIARTKIKKVIHETSSIDISLNDKQNISVDKLPDTPQTMDTKGITNSLNEIDKDTNSVKEYMHNLLRYINYNDAALNNDKDGDLHFFMNHMPDIEKKMSFGDWIQHKLLEINKEFVKNITKKSSISKDAFAELVNRIESIDENDDNHDSFLINICSNLS